MNKDELVKQMSRMFAPELAKNNAAEQDAILGYYELLNRIDDWCCNQANGNPAVKLFWTKYLQELSDTIEEIIADELNHTEKLNKLITKFGHVRPNKE